MTSRTVSTSWNGAGVDTDENGRTRNTVEPNVDGTRIPTAEVEARTRHADEAEVLLTMTAAADEVKARRQRHVGIVVEARARAGIAAVAAEVPTLSRAVVRVQLPKIADAEVPTSEGGGTATVAEGTDRIPSRRIVAAGAAGRAMTTVVNKWFVSFNGGWL